MAEDMIYTRAYSVSSAGPLISAKGPMGDPLTHTELLAEFRNHSNSWNREPTALVSVSNRIIDTVKRAFDKYYVNGDSPADIWVAFIEVPERRDETPTQIHAALPLAEECGILEANKFRHEIVFEWAIPEEFVIHKVSLQTLISRGLQRGEQFGPELQFKSTAGLRRDIATELKAIDHSSGSWEVGIYLASFARTFGARAPLDWIAHRLFYDCVHTTIVDDDVVRVNYLDERPKCVNFDFFCELDDGVDTVLYDWWLTDVDFCLDYEEFRE
ncbi:uncharacterized protein NECHADRAFT_88376 [Fusarium vanettenii 77-13-4]|uniref:DUF7587 domain-containing protein n=1 Tax=Fusarium vanettenii (strain ATCC MYA-4622 / CBS 123669 / FGSC 9596 / NRRL 45880 / 77-13-4) TaxID=660122 RepID=C7ZM94_FUSV7|nr:uncharacterized protein NECHADRAFT_88376 [Fusarium vanettenii 77-13-4]EEU34875.1 predicted protein [Fusarium vanettenii 77-13-4]